MSEYYIPTGPGEAEFTEKRSRFLGHIRMVETEDEARAFIAEMKKKYYDARHNCWCYSIRDGAERYSDDGEPQGSAGIPMLEVLRRQGVTNAYAQMERMKLEAAAAGGIVADVVYGADVTLKVLVPEEQSEGFAARIYDQSAGSVQVRFTGESFRAVPLK